MKDPTKLIDKADKTLSALENKEIQRLQEALDRSFRQLEKELLRRFPDYTADSQPGLLATQRSLLLLDQLKDVITLVDPGLEKEISDRFEKLLQTASSEGKTLAEELIKLQQGESFLKSTANIPIESVAFAAKDAVGRLKKHDQAFQEEASIIVQQGLIQGWGAQRVATQLRQRLGVAKGRAEAIARTEVMAAQDSASRATYKANGIDYYVRVATQDARICSRCAARAGQVYSVDVPVALHPSDRCVSVPILIDDLINDPKYSSWIVKHSQESKAASESGVDYSRSPFEAASGAEAAKPVWTPEKGFLDESILPSKQPTPEPPKQPKEKPIPAIDPASHKSLSAAGRSFAGRFEVERYLTPSAEEKAAIDRLNSAKSRLLSGDLDASDEFLQAEQDRDSFEQQRIETLRSQSAELLKVLNGQSSLSKAKADQMAGATAIEVEGSNDWGKGSNDRVRKDLAAFHRMTGGKANIVQLISEDDRGWADDTTRIVNIGDKDGYAGGRVLFHEAGHLLEASDSGYQKAAEAWVRSRATSQTPLPLREITGDDGYDEDETALPDDFYSPYVGKIYDDGATEAISMGIEAFVDGRRLSNLIRYDIEHFYFVLGVVLHAQSRG